MNERAPLAGMFYRCKDGNRWPTAWQFICGWDFDRFKAIRFHVAPKLRAVVKLGACWRSLATSFAQEIETLPKGADGIQFSYALYMRCQFEVRTWAHGPPRKGDQVWMFPNALEDSPMLARRDRLR